MRGLVDDEVQEGPDAADPLQPGAHPEFVADFVPQPPVVAGQKPFAEVPCIAGFPRTFDGVPGRVHGIADALAGEGVDQAGGISEEHEAVAVDLSVFAARGQVPADGTFQGRCVRKPVPESGAFDGLFQGRPEVDALLFDLFVHHADADVGAAVFEGKDPEVAGDDFVDIVQLNLVSQPFHAPVVTPQGHDRVARLVFVASRFAGDDGVESVGAQDDAAPVFRAFRAARSPDAAYPPILPDQVADGEPFDAGIGGLSGLFEEKGVEYLPPDHKSGEEVLSAGAREVDVDFRAAGAAEGDGVDGGAGQGADPIEQAQVPQDTDGFAGKGVSTDFVAGESGFVQEEGAQAVAFRVECGRGPCGPSAHDDKVVGSIFCI